VACRFRSLIPKWPSVDLLDVLPVYPSPYLTLTEQGTPLPTTMRPLFAPLIGRIASIVAYWYKQSSVGGLSVCLCVCLCVGHVREPRENGWTDWHGIWKADSGGPKESRVGWGYRSPNEKGQFLKVIWPIQKHRKSLLRFSLQMDHSIHRQAEVGCRLAGITLNFLRREKPSPAMRPFVKILWPLVRPGDAAVYRPPE